MKHTPGPWEALKSSNRQPSGKDWYVARDVSPRPSFSHYEQMCDENGKILMFETESMAIDAITLATGSE